MLHHRSFGNAVHVLVPPNSFLQWVGVLSSTASLTVAPLEHHLFDLTNSFSSSSGVVRLPPLTLSVAAVPGLSGLPRTLRIVAMEGSAAKRWVEASGKAAYSPLESIGSEAGVQLVGNSAAVTGDATLTLSVSVSAWAQPTFMLMAVCDGAVAVIDAVPPAYLKRGVLLPPPVFSMPQPVVPAAMLTFDTVAFPSTLLEGAVFSMKLTLPAAGLPSALTLQGACHRRFVFLFFKWLRFLILEWCSLCHYVTRASSVF